MASTGQPINLTLTTGDGASVAISSGSHSAAQSGSGNTAQIDHGPATDLSVLAPLLQELARAIGELPSAKARAMLTPHAQAARAEAHEQDQPDPGIIKRALDAIKPAAEVLDSGEKIVALCNRAYQALSQFTGLPPSPLP